MSYRIISADCHIDMTWMPGDLWVKNAPARFRTRFLPIRRRQLGHAAPDGRQRRGAMPLVVTSRTRAAWAGVRRSRRENEREHGVIAGASSK